MFLLTEISDRHRERERERRVTGRILEEELAAKVRKAQALADFQV